MKKIIKYLMSISLVFFLFPVTAQEPKTYEAICGLQTAYDYVYIKPSRIIGPISLDDFAATGNIGVEALVDGNGNQARFSNQIEYKKIGNRIELDLDYFIPTNASSEPFQEHFGLFPTVTCTAG
jgi:hypothetical protein